VRSLVVVAAGLGAEDAHRGCDVLR
jgi:hypothetical protein